MIQMQSLLKVTDNSGARSVRCLKVLGGSKRWIANVGDLIVVSIRDAQPNGKVKKGEVKRAVIVRTVSPVRRPDGTQVRFDSNAVVLVDGQGEPLGTRVLGPVTREVREGYPKIVSLAAGMF